MLLGQWEKKNENLVSKNECGEISDEKGEMNLGFEIKKAEIARKEMTVKQEERECKYEEPNARVRIFEARNWILFVNQNVMSIIRFYTGSVKFTIGWLDRMTK